MSELCVTSMEQTSDKYTASIKERGKPSEAVLLNQLLSVALEQIDKCWKADEYADKADGFSKAAFATYQLSKATESQGYAEKCLDIDTLHTSCYVLLALSQKELRKSGDAKRTIAKGIQVAKVVVDKSQRSFFDTSEKLKAERGYFERKNLELDLRLLRANIKHAEYDLEVLEGLAASK